MNIILGSVVNLRTDFFSYNHNTIHIFIQCYHIHFFIINIISCNFNWDFWCLTATTSINYGSEDN
jgi:hypothetical protein